MECISGDAGSCAGVVEAYMLGLGGILQVDKRPVTAQRDPLAAELRSTHWHACPARCVCTALSSGAWLEEDWSHPIPGHGKGTGSTWHLVYSGKT